jgi:hypothetical protein
MSWLFEYVSCQDFPTVLFLALSLAAAVFILFFLCNVSISIYAVIFL